MEELIIKRFNGTNLSLKYNDFNNTYLAVDVNDSRVRFDIGDKWRYIGDKGGLHYLRESTKSRIINEAKARAFSDTKIQDFVDWYNNLYGVKQEDIEEVHKQDDNLNDKFDTLLEVMRDMNHRTEEHTRLFEAAIVSGIVDKTKEIQTNDIKEEVIKYLKDFVKKEYGKLPTTIEIINGGERVQTEGIFHKQFESILKLVTQKIPLLLVGPAGSGKNHTLEQVAEALGLDFYFTNSITQEYKLTGFIDAGGVYHETEFYKAFKNGGLFFFDELDASCAESLIVVNAALANGYVDFPNGRINAHPDFRVVAAANTFGNGADMIYVGRNQLDGATLDRFAVIEFEYDEDIERQLCYDDELYEFIADVRKAINKRNLRFIVSMRATINASKMLQVGIDKKTIIKTCITKSMTEDDINTIKRELTCSNEWTRLL